MFVRHLAQVSIDLVADIFVRERERNCGEAGQGRFGLERVHEMNFGMEMTEEGMRVLDHCQRGWREVRGNEDVLNGKAVRPVRLRGCRQGTAARRFWKRNSRRFHVSNMSEPRG